MPSSAPRKSFAPSQTAKPPNRPAMASLEPLRQSRPNLTTLPLHSYHTTFSSDFDEDDEEYQLEKDGSRELNVQHHIGTTTMLSEDGSEGLQKRFDDEAAARSYDTKLLAALTAKAQEELKLESLKARSPQGAKNVGNIPLKHKVRRESGTASDFAILAEQRNQRVHEYMESDRRRSGIGLVESRPMSSPVTPDTTANQEQQLQLQHPSWSSSAPTTPKKASIRDWLWQRTGTPSARNINSADSKPNSRSKQVAVIQVEDDDRFLAMSN